jgi:hypothetical protein
MKRGFLDLLDPSNDPEFFWQVISGPPCIFEVTAKYVLFFISNFLGTNLVPKWTRYVIKM